MPRNTQVTDEGQRTLLRRLQETEVCFTHESTVLSGVLELTNEVTLGEFWCVSATVND